MLACARPANVKQIVTSASSATAFAALVSCCTRSPSLLPRMSSAVTSDDPIIAMIAARVAGIASRPAADSPMTIAIAAVDAHVDTQSIQPTTKPA